MKNPIIKVYQQFLTNTFFLHRTRNFYPVCSTKRSAKLTSVPPDSSANPKRNFHKQTHKLHCKVSLAFPPQSCRGKAQTKRRKRSKPVFHRPFYVILRVSPRFEVVPPKTAGSEKHGLKFSMSTPYSVPLKAFSPHRTLARGRCEPILKLRRIGGLNQGVTPKKIRGTFIRREPGQKLNWAVTWFY